MTPLLSWVHQEKFSADLIHTDEMIINNNYLYYEGT